MVELKLYGDFMKEGIKVKGLLQIFDAKTNELLFEKNNLVLNTGLALMVDNMKVSTAVLTHIAVGTGTTAVIATDTALETELYRKAVTNIDTLANVLTVETQMNAIEANAIWKECGILTASSGGILFNRINIDFNKTSADVVNIKFTITLTVS